MPSKQFRPGFEATASQPFTFAGVKYAKGERFPYRDLGIIDFDLRGLWLAERIEFGDDAYRGKPAAPGSTPSSGKPQQGQQQPRR